MPLKKMKKRFVLRSLGETARQATFTVCLFHPRSLQDMDEQANKTKEKPGTSRIPRYP